MTPRTIISILATACLVELAVIVGLVGRLHEHPGLTVPVPVTAAPLAGQSTARAGTEESKVETSSGRSTPTPAPSRPALEAELAAVKSELEARKSEISFSYGSVRESGRFVGMTFRKMFEAAAARGTPEAQARTADNQINVLSLGPFIQDAEVIESDPGAFAQFQGALVSEMLGLPAQQGQAVESLLADLKTKSLRFEAGSPEWAELNDNALQGVTATLTDEQKQAVKAQIDFLRQYGVLVIPAYSILRAPAPTIASP
jgi:hypothetical protein